MKKILMILFFIQFSFLGYSQVNKYLVVVSPGNDMPKFLKKQSYKKIFSDSLLLNLELKTIVSKCFVLGYIESSFDSIWSINDTVYAKLVIGEKYLWNSVSLKNLETDVVKSIGVKEKSFNKKTVVYDDLFLVQNKIISFYENVGYPFASIKMDSVTINNSTIKGALLVEKNDLFIIDSIFIKGDTKISGVFIENYLGVSSGDFYNEEKIIAISNKIKELAFVEEIKPIEIRFKDKKADIFIYIKDKKANSFNGMIGFLPSDKTTGNILLIGEVNLFLQNSFNRGEIIEFNWKKLETASQNLEIHFNYPYLLSTPIGIDTRFELYKKDTVYLTMKANAGIQYMLQGTDFVKVYVETKSSSLISTKGLESLTVVPQYADVNTILYGTGYSINRLDYLYNPKKGYSFVFNVGAGKKTIEKNSAIPEIAYEGLDIVSTQVEGDLKFSFYNRVGDNFTLKLKNNTGYIYNTSLFENELYRLGGLNTIRGFNENSIYASVYSIFTIEYRFIFEQNSALYVFWDGAYYEKDLVDSFVSDYPYGFGAGMDFETKAGIFTINYAIGKQFDNPIQVRAAKIHFGYINRF